MFFLLLFLVNFINATECPFSGTHENDFLEILEDFPQKMYYVHEERIKLIVEGERASKDLFEIVKKGLKLTPYQINNLHISVHENYFSDFFNMGAVNDINTVILNQSYAQAVLAAAHGDYLKVTFSNDESTFGELRIPGSLALRRFLGAFKHEMTHIQKGHTYVGSNQPPVDREREADLGILPQHCRASFVRYITSDIMMCYDETNLFKLKSEHNYPVLDSTALFKHHAHDVYHTLFPWQTHPSDRERALSLLHRAKEYEQTPEGQNFLQKNPPSYQCATFKVFKKLSWFETLLKKSKVAKTFQICESGEVTITDHNSGKTETINF